MTDKRNNFVLPVSNATRLSSARAMENLGTYLEQCLTNAAQPFAEKQSAYLSSYERNVRSRNHRYILTCKGEEE